MTPEQTTAKTTASTTESPADVAIVGGGPAGCSAGVFTARAGLETVLFEHERSSLLKSAHLENYLGFPLGIQPAQFLDLAREHATEAGCRYRREAVVNVWLEGSEERREPEGTRQAATERGEPASERTFVLETDGGVGGTEPSRYRANRLLVASWAHTDCLESLPVTREPEEPGPVMVLPTDGDGRTDCEGVYAAGRITSQHHQTIVNAGHGAHVALTLIRDDRPEYYNDWVVPEGYYARYDREVPDGVEEISIAERSRRKAKGIERMAAVFNDESVKDC
ncbi:FAD-binding protein [Halobacteria archaeon AArc-m2/3/4]|uniref:FAD-binding protein n=1 Tax=Natronoglomus mannanivorans TaxID=2979990 RepID=A0ABT2QF99_9EURY|nr:FAD-binding protein [Halobacteria archaeon AArc-m2/3/4]